MGSWEPATWSPQPGAPTRRARQGGHYRRYIPDPLLDRPLVLSSRVQARSASVERSVRRLTVSPGSDGLESLARFLLRSEAIASSRIEGVQVSPQQVALAELADQEGLAIRLGANARLVANNMITVRRAVEEIAHAETIGPEDVVGLQRALLPEHASNGLRDVQNWIGGSDWHPLDAEFVPPPSSRVPELMVDLTRYLGGALHAPLLQAALGHAQLETIHPLNDGNGRVGRALIHTVLTRRGLTRRAVLPVSLVLLTQSERYVEGLTAYRYEGPVDGAGAREGTQGWIETFLTAAETATQEADRLARAVDRLRQEWEERHAESRTRAGLRATPRADSAAARLLGLLHEAPVLTARTVQHLLDVSFPAARSALDELAGAAVLRPKRIERGTTAFLALEVFELLTLAERRLASTRWDTRESPPARPVPARPAPGRAR